MIDALGVMAADLCMLFACTLAFAVVLLVVGVCGSWQLARKAVRGELRATDLYQEVPHNPNSKNHVD